MVVHRQNGKDMMATQYKKTELRRDGGVPFTMEEETQLWTKGIIGIETPRMLFNAISYNGKDFCLRNVYYCCIVLYSIWNL